MDPLSAGASVIAVIQVTAQCAKLLTTVIITLRDAPEDILALSNEVSDLNLVLTEVASTTPSPNVLKLINRANAMLRILESLLREWMRPHGTGGEVKFERFAWFRHSKKARVLQAQLRELKLGIVAGLVSGQT